ncbi:hypothetical protein P0Y35_18725 [Kiritimatiellaeota bacterium B1221]|nr:hypothetical protein [Kiritimatiellaeota bacterium B1221]
MKTSLRTMIVIFALAFVSCAKHDTRDLLQLYLSDNLEMEDRVAAKRKLVSKGVEVLPILIQEMNDSQYISEELDHKVLGDQKWQKRILIAGVIEDVSEQDFSVRTTAHGWNPDYSFDLINEWWKKRGSSLNTQKYY